MQRHEIAPYVTSPCFRKDLRLYILPFLNNLFYPDKYSEVEKKTFKIFFN